MMRKCFSIILMTGAVLAAPALAASDDQFELDRKLAERSITKELQQHCVKSFSEKMTYSAPLQPAGNFSFNPWVSREVYRAMYWKQSDRGIAFTVPVRVSDPERGEIAGNLACFYAVTDHGIVFQGAQQITWKF